MFRNVANTILILSTVIIGTASAARPQYTLSSISDQELRIDVALPVGICKDTGPFYMAFSTMPGIGYSAAIIHDNGNICKLSHQSAGWAGNDYLQWCSYNPACIPCADTVLHSSIMISFTEPVFRGFSRKDAVCTNGIVRLPSLGKKMKKSSITVKKPLFTSGLKIAIENDGIYELSYDLLRQNGVPVERISSRTYRLYERDHEIPLCITNEYHASLTRDDRILFYGRKLRSGSGRLESFSETNIYWLTWGGDISTGVPNIGTRVSIVSGARRIDPTIYSASKHLQPGDFTDTLHLEVDNTIIWLGNLTDRLPEELIAVPGEDIVEIDNWYWGEVGLRDLTNFTFDVPSPVARGIARMSIGMMGLSSIDSIDNDHNVDVFINNEPVSRSNRIAWDGQKYVVFESDTFSTDLLLHGSNLLTLQTNTVKFADRSVLDWIKIVYTRGYESINDAVCFKNTRDTFGKLTEYTITGFTTDDIELWDITHYRLFAGILTEDGTGKLRNTHTLIFQDSISSTVQYFAQVKANRMIPATMRYDTIFTDWDTLALYEYLVVSVDSFKTDLEPLLDIHRKNGRTAAFVDIDDLYNRFSFGIRDPECIRLFLQYLHEKNGRTFPRFVLFGGDATHDMDKKNKNRTIVPVHLSRIPGWGPGADDGYFASINNDDLFPDCCIGRFPAQNRVDMKRMVEKTVRYIREPDYGYWRDNMLLLGGGDPAFTEFNDMAAGEVIGTRMHIDRMDADPGSVFYKDGFVAPKRIADHLNTGMFIVNFNGHGGGNVWSDNDFFGFNDLSLLHNGEWKGGRLPVIFSFTCLTGFFESSEYRSLGEEFVRAENDGAIAFYGASAYTSQNGNIVMNRLFLEEAVTANHTTIGELVNYCEMSMLVRYRTQYLNLVRQYNLLGDPALPLFGIADTLRISDTINDHVTTLTIDGNTAPIDNGQVKLSLVSNYATLDQTVLPVSDGKFVHTFQLKEGMKATLATIRAYAWNDSGAIKSRRTFVKDILALDEVTLDPAQPFFNDSVYITCKIVPSNDSVGEQVYCMYAITTNNLSRAAFEGIIMKPLKNGEWGSERKVYLDYKENAGDRLALFFRVISSGTSVQSSVMTFTIKGRPDYAINGKALTIQWIDDSLQIPFEVQNIGNTPSPPFTAVLCWSRKDIPPDTFAVVTSPDSLDPGDRYKFTIAVDDTMGDLSYFALIDPTNAVLEVSEGNNRLDGTVRIIYRDMRSITDTLSVDATTAITPAHAFDETHRIFIFEDTLATVSPLATSSVWRSKKNNIPVKWELAGRPGLATGDSIQWIYSISSDALADTAYRKTAVMIFDTIINAWRYGAGLVHGKNVKLTMVTNHQGWCAIASLADVRPPEMMATIYGKSLVSIDYAAKDRPFCLFLSDPSLILPQSVVLLLNNKKLSSDAHSSLPVSGDLNTITISAYPQIEKRVDSLTVQCTDLAGNFAQRTFAYLPGTDLTIKSFTCHPNPFTARRNGNGTISKIRFAFLLTDIANNATLSIFTVSGKKIRTWSEHELIGYQQIEWDGRDYEGYRIANGTYYARLSVKNDRKKDTKIIRIAKLEGF